MVKKWKSIMEMAFSLVLNYWEKEEGYKKVLIILHSPQNSFLWIIMTSVLTCT